MPDESIAAKHRPGEIPPTVNQEFRSLRPAIFGACGQAITLTNAIRKLRAMLLEVDANAILLTNHVTEGWPIEFVKPHLRPGDHL